MSTAIVIFICVYVCLNNVAKLITENLKRK